MTVGSGFDSDAESSGLRIGRVSSVRRVFVGSCVLLAIVVVMLVQLSSAPTTRMGAQSAPAGRVVVQSAAVDSWEPFLPTAGRLRAGFPPPMVRTADRVCIGFARLDFGPDDVRPSLARCERRRGDALAPNEIRVLVTVKDGFDTWHFIEAAGHIESIEVNLTNGAVVRPERLLLSGSTGALRLENDRDLASIEWSTSTATYRCAAEPIAWRTARFCSDAR